MMRAGVGIGEVKLALPIKNLQYQMDPLYVKVLQTEAFILVCLDVTSMPKEAINYFKGIVSRKTAVPEENIIFTMAHSFSSPHFHNSDNYDAIVSALVEALSLVEMKECRIGFSRDECDINVQRNIETEEGWWIGRNPDGYSNKEVKSIFLFERDEGVDKPFACMINAGVQSSCVMSLDKRAVSADLPGAIADIYKKMGITAFFLPGACADQGPISADHKILGEKLVEAVTIPEAKEWESCRLHRNYVSLPMQKMQIPTKMLTPHKSFSFESTGEVAEIPLILLQLNEILLCMTAPELNSAYGKQLEKYLPQSCMVVTMTDGAYKYLPQEWDYDNITYEAMNTVIGRGSDRIFLDTLKGILEEI